MCMLVLLLEDFILDVNVWFLFYKCIVSVCDEIEFDELKVEFIDCFGKLLDVVCYLLYIVELC